MDQLELHLYADADFAGCPRTLRSTSGAHLNVEAALTCFPQTCLFGRQTSMANSTPEAEIVSLYTALKRVMLPAMEFYDALWKRKYTAVVHEDNTGTIQIASTGINKTMRWLGRSHVISIRFLYEKLGTGDEQKEITLVYTRSEWMSADIYTKSFDSAAKWEQALELINICEDDKVAELIKRRQMIYQKMRKDVIVHPNNVRPRQATEAANRVHCRREKGEHITVGAGVQAADEAGRIVRSKIKQPGN